MNYCKGRSHCSSNQFLIKYFLIQNLFPGFSVYKLAFVAKYYLHCKYITKENSVSLPNQTDFSWSSAERRASINPMGPEKTDIEETQRI